MQYKTTHLFCKPIKCLEQNGSHLYLSLHIYIYIFKKSDIPKSGLLFHSPPFPRSNVAHQTPHNDLISAIFLFNSQHVNSHRWRPLTCQPPQSSAAFVILSLNMCHFCCHAVSPACLDKWQFEVLLVREYYGITYHRREKPDVALLTCMSFKAGL